MDLSIVIVSWNVKDKLYNNLSAIFSSRGVYSFEVFVVDNASTDGSADMVRQEFPQVRLIANQENIGFARANNLALKQATGEFILLLNPDMLPGVDTFTEALIWARFNPQAVVSGCRLVGPDGQTIEQVRRFPRLSDQLFITLKLPHVFPALLNSYLNKGFDYNRAAKVDSLRGAFFLINRARYKEISGQDVPQLDERYFVWFEEVDFCRQIYKQGGEVWYCPNASCLDYVGASFKQLPLGQGQNYFSDSMIKYFAKWHKPWEASILRAAWRLVRLFI